MQIQGHWVMQGGQRSEPRASVCGSVLSSRLFSQDESVVCGRKWGVQHHQGLSCCQSASLSAI